MHSTQIKEYFSIALTQTPNLSDISEWTMGFRPAILT